MHKKNPITNLFPLQMANFLVLSFVFLYSIIGFSQKSIIVGPQNDCATKKISRNTHTSSAFLELGNSIRIKITTVQHRTYDASRIYDQNGSLIWEWKGESRSDTWYTKEHFVTVNSSKIKIEFTQGYSDPFCNGYIKAEVIEIRNNLIENQSVNTSGLTNTKNETIQNSVVKENEEDNSQQVIIENFKIVDTKLNLTYEDFKNALNLYYFAFKSKIEINSIIFNPMKLLITRGYIEFYGKGLFGGGDKKYDEYLDVLSGKSDGKDGTKSPRTYGDNSAWQLSIPRKTDIRGNNISKRFHLDSKKIISNFKLEVDMQLSAECKECNKLIEKYYDLFKTSLTISEIEFNELKLAVNRCKDQQFENLKKKSTNYLNILSGIEPGGPSSYSKYYLSPVTGYKGNKIKPLSILESTKLKSNDLLIKTNVGFGVSNSEGYVFIEPIYDKIELINYRGEYVYLATENDEQGIIGYSGEIKLDFEYDKIIANPNNQFIFVNNDKKWWVLGPIGLTGANGPHEDDIFTPKSTLYDDVFVLNDFFVVKQNELFGLLMKDGKLNGTIKYDSINKIGSNNSAIIAIKLNDKWGFVHHLKVLYGIKDEIFKYSTYQQLTDNNDLILVRSNGKIGFVNRKGRELFAPIYNEYKMDGKDRIFLASNSGWGIYTLEYGTGISNNQYRSIERFVNTDYYKIEINNKFGVLTQYGNELVQPQFDKIFEIQFDAEFQDTFLCVSSNNKYGSVSLDKVNKENIHTTPIQFASINDVKNEWQKNKNVLIQRKLDEENRIRLEQERIRREEKQKIYEAELNYCKNKVIEFETFVKNFNNYFYKLKNGSINPSMSEYSRWESDINKELRKIEECSDSEYNGRITNAKLSLQETATQLYTSSGSNQSNSRSNQQNQNSNSSSKSHSYKVYINWDNPVSSAEYPNRPIVTNGYIDLYNKKSSSYFVQPVCPICSKKSKDRISGYGAGKGEKISSINCLGN